MKYIVCPAWYTASQSNNYLHSHIGNLIVLMLNFLKHTILVIPFFKFDLPVGLVSTGPLGMRRDGNKISTIRIKSIVHLGPLDLYGNGLQADSSGSNAPE